MLKLPVDKLPEKVTPEPGAMSIVPLFSFITSRLTIDPACIPDNAPIIAEADGKVLVGVEPFLQIIT